jgi:molecular chaperone DnaK (HSP70)
VTARLFQGESRNARDNRLIGRVTLDGIRPQPSGEADIELSLAIDEGGIVSATLKDVERGVEVTKRFHAETGLDDDDLAAIRGISEDEETGPEAEPEPEAEPAIDEPEPANDDEEIFAEDVDSVSNSSDSPEDSPSKAEPEQGAGAPEVLDPPETAQSDSAPAEAEPTVETGPAELLSDDDAPPMPGAPRWERVAAE